MRCVQASVATASTGRRPWPVFAILFTLMVVDYVDRQVVVSMFPFLKAEWSLSDGQLGALASAVAITVALGTLPLSLLADRWSAVKSLFLMALVWSCATVACAFAATYEHLLAARALVGLGEAAYGSVGAALLAGIFPTRLRSTVMGAFLAAALVGSVAGLVLGGVVAQAWGWRAGFGIAGAPGLLLALLFLLVAHEPRTEALPVAPGARTRLRGAARAIAGQLATRTVIVTCVGAGLQLVALSALYAWLPSYFNRYYGLSPADAGVRASLIVLTGAPGAIVASLAADRLRERFARARLYVPATAALFTAIFMSAAFGLLPPGPMQFALIVAGGFTLTGTIGPVPAAVVDVVHPSIRATAAAMLALIQNLFGLAGGPLLGGMLSDRYGLGIAMAVVPLFCLLAAVVLALAARSYPSIAANMFCTRTPIGTQPPSSAASAP
jgi:predicted MFS family arabinose efflux permease